MEKPQYENIVYTMAQHEQLLLKLEDLEKRAFSKSYISFYNYDMGQTNTFYSDEETVAKFKDLITEANYHQSEFKRYKLLLQQSTDLNNVLEQDLNNLRIKLFKLEQEKPKRFLGFLWTLKGKNK